VWLYAGGVSLILPDVRFGTVSLDEVTNQPITSQIIILATGDLSSKIAFPFIQNVKIIKSK